MKTDGLQKVKSRGKELGGGEETNIDACFAYGSCTLPTETVCENIERGNFKYMMSVGVASVRERENYPEKSRRERSVKECGNWTSRRSGPPDDVTPRII